MTVFVGCALAACSGSRSKTTGTSDARAGAPPGGDSGRGQGGAGGVGGSGGAGTSAGAAGGAIGGGAGDATAGSGGTTAGAGGTAGAPGTGGTAGEPGAGGAGGPPGDPGGEGGESPVAGSAGAAGSAGQPSVGPDPSPGCANANPNPETYLSHYEGTYVTLPPGYDGTTPFPMLIGFHETNIPSQFRSSRLTQHPLAQSYVIVAPQKVQTVGTFEGLQPSTVNPLLDEVLATYCIDEKNLVAAGQGSGARFLGTAICNGRAIATSPDVHFSALGFMGAYSRCSTWPAVPLLFIHGYNATESRFLNNDADGAKALAGFTKNSECDATSVAFPLRSCNTQSTITPGCVEYEGCTAPLRFCVHDDSIQGNSGWACIANDELLSFFEAHRAQ